MHNKWSDETGFTVVELLIAFTVFAMLMLVVYSTFFSGYKNMTNQLMVSRVNRDATIAMTHIQEAVDDYGVISVNNNQLRSIDGILIDCDNSDLLEGSQLSLDRVNHNLVDGDANIIAANVENIQFVKGPAIYDGLGVMNDVLLIVIDMEYRDVTFKLKGGVHIER